MATKKQVITNMVTHYQHLIVTPIAPELSGSDVFSTEGFTMGKGYPVLATSVKVWEDGSTTPVFLVANDSRAIQEVAMTSMKVLVVDGELK